MRTSKTHTPSASATSQPSINVPIIDLTSMFPDDTNLFTCKLVCTESVWNLICDAASAEGTNNAQYVWDVSWMAYSTAKNIFGDETNADSPGGVRFTVGLPIGHHYKLLLTYGVCEDGESVLIVSRPDEYK